MGRQALMWGALAVLGYFVARRARSYLTIPAVPDAQGDELPYAPPVEFIGPAYGNVEADYTNGYAFFFAGEEPVWLANEVPGAF